MDTELIDTELIDTIPSFKIGISKYNNLDGVSCYIISILHILQQIPCFSNYLINNEYLNSIKHKQSRLLVHELYKLFKTSYENDNINITPVSFKKLIGQLNPMWSEIQHQDSQEFLIFLISQLEEELGNPIFFVPGKIYKNCELSMNSIFLKMYGLQYLKKNQISDYSIIKQLFIGTLVSNLKCRYCKTISPNFESFITVPLCLPIKNQYENLSLKDCLDSFTKDEILDIHNMVDCNICGLKNQSIKTILFWKTPKIIILQLKRFIVNNYGEITSKISNNVDYPIKNLNLYNYFHPESPYKNNSVYNLLGVNIHQSIDYHNNINAGHYISLVKNHYDNQWYIFNDSFEPELKNENDLIDNNAYLLFYYRND
jgi:ubiquitin C-terminal hydrolase